MKIKKRNPFVPAALLRKAGAHKKSTKAQRRAQTQQHQKDVRKSLQGSDQAE
jgi:hypothetical protein